MSAIYFDIVYPDGHKSERQEFAANSDRHLLHFLASALNNIVEGKITNVKIY
jgi:hypothetical protein